AAALYARATGGKAGSPVSAAAVWLLPVASIALALTIGRRLYAVTLPAVGEQFTVASGRTHRLTASVGAPIFPRRLRGPEGALVERDLVALARNPHELGRAGFIALLLALYTTFIVVAPLRSVGTRTEAIARLTLFNVAAAGYFLTAFGLRF